MKDYQEADRRVPEKERESERSESKEKDSCRCKEASRLSPGQLLKLMMNDLAFWKKADRK